MGTRSRKQQKDSFVDMYHGDEIKESAKGFLRKNRKSLVEQEGWREPLTDRDLLLDLIESFSKD